MPDRPPLADDFSALAGLANELAASFASIASDVALVVDAGGVIRGVAGGQGLQASEEQWLGRPWTDLVTRETQAKIRELLSEAATGVVARRRQVNHHALDGEPVPVAYSAVRLGRDGPVLAAGRDLRTMAAIQQRFVESQQEMERHYWKLRQSELRYRQLFQVATDGVLVLDAVSRQITDANDAACTLLARSNESLAGRPLEGMGLTARSLLLLEQMLAGIQATGRPAEIRVWREDPPGSIDVSAMPLRSEGGVALLVLRLREAGGQRLAAEASTLAEMVERTPDAIVITDGQGRVLMANPAYAGLSGSPAESDLRGHPVEFAGPGPGDGVDTAALLDEVRRHGIVARRRLRLKDRNGHATSVEVSAALLDDGDQESVGITMRRHDGGDVPAPPQAPGDFAEAWSRMAEQLGAVPLPHLVRQASEFAEQHLLKSALARCAGDVDAAAELLGVSAHNLGLRLARYGLAPAAGPAEGGS